MPRAASGVWMERRWRRNGKLDDRSLPVNGWKFPALSRERLGAQRAIDAATGECNMHAGTHMGLGQQRRLGRPAMQRRLSSLDWRKAGRPFADRTLRIAEHEPEPVPGGRIHHRSSGRTAIQRFAVHSGNELGIRQPGIVGESRMPRGFSGLGIEVGRDSIFASATGSQRVSGKAHDENIARHGYPYGNEISTLLVFRCRLRFSLC